MAHNRPRHVTELILKKLKFNPVLAIQGARQTGKSLLAREILGELLPQLHYESLDQFKVFEFVSLNPGLFLAQHEDAFPLVIDEAQKVPKIFDEVKFEVDQKRTPGKYILLGSTEFSKLTLIRESLTGRMSRVRLFPLNVAETLRLPPNPSKLQCLALEKPRVTRAQFLQYLNRGGMPGIFAVRSEEERKSFLQDWLDLTTQRDVSLIPKIKIDIELCRRILEHIATLEEPDAGSLARILKKDLRKIKTHLHCLETLFVVARLSPHKTSTGKPLYFLCDVSFVEVLGGGFEKKLYTWLIQEQMSQRSYRDDRANQLSYYRTPKGSRINLVVENSENSKEISVIKLLTQEALRTKDLEILKSFSKRNEGLNINLIALGAQRLSLKKDKIEVYPWEALC